MQHYRKTLCGFTLAELILAMAIVSILTAAMVPMLKYHKVRQNQKFTPHGVYECFYDDDGVLHSYAKDNDKNLSGKYDKHLSGGTCLFPVPKSNYYELHIIEPGTPGGGFSQDGEDYIFEKSYLTKSADGARKTSVIAVDSSFSTNVEELPYYVLQSWEDYDSQGNKTLQQLEINAPRGNKAFSKTEEEYVREWNDDGSGENLTTKSVTTYYGEGNKGNGYKVTLQVHPNSNIVNNDPNSIKESQLDILILDNTTLVREKSNLSNYGNYGLCNGRPNTDQYQGNCGNNVIIACTGSTYACSQSAALRNSEKTVSLQGEYKNLVPDGGLKFEYSEQDLHYKYGLSGDTGKLVKTFYNKINAKTLNIIPAKDYTQGTIVTKVTASATSDIYNSKTKNFISTKKGVSLNDKIKLAISGTAKSYYEHFKSLTPIPDVKNSDMPVPEALINKREDLTPQNPNYTQSYCTVEGTDDISKNGLCHQTVKYKTITKYPGLAGYGGYPVLYSLAIDESIYMTDSKGKNELRASGTASKANTYEQCFSGEEPVEHSNNYYCKGTEGGSGAVILLW